MSNFRQLAVWRRAHQFTLRIYRLTASFPSDQRYSLAIQLQRAAVSVCSNIAEGCGRTGDAEMRRFLRIARGSSHEVECQLLLARDLGYVTRGDWETLNSECRTISAMLFNLADSLGRFSKKRSS